MKMLSVDENAYRYERKYFISGFDNHSVESIVNLHPGIFSKIFHERKINNIYLDTPDLENYFDNIDGNSKRIKMRIRWYGDLFQTVKNPILEIKTKNGLLGGKLRYALNPFRFDTNFCTEIFENIINKSKIPEELKQALNALIPALVNSYTRKYFLSANKKFRITIDCDQEFYQIFLNSNSFAKKLYDKTNIILELKYGIDFDNEAKEISKYLPFRLTKSSKYVTGIEKIHS